MVIVLDKVTRDIVGVADTIRQAKDLRLGIEAQTICEIVGLAYIPRLTRG